MRRRPSVNRSRLRIICISGHVADCLRGSFITGRRRRALEDCDRHSALIRLLRSSIRLLATTAVEFDPLEVPRVHYYPREHTVHINFFVNGNLFKLRVFVSFSISPSPLWSSSAASLWQYGACLSIRLHIAELICNWIFLPSIHPLDCRSRPRCGVLLPVHQGCCCCCCSSSSRGITPRGSRSRCVVVPILAWRVVADEDQEPRHLWLWP